MERHLLGLLQSNLGKLLLLQPQRQPQSRQGQREKLSQTWKICMVLLGLLQSNLGKLLLLQPQRQPQSRRGQREKLSQTSKICMVLPRPLLQSPTKNSQLTSR